MIRNYTSSQPVSTSISFIEQKLAAFGVSEILSPKPTEPVLPIRRAAALRDGMTEKEGQ